MAKNDPPEHFEYTPEGRKKAREWADSVGKLEELDALRSIYESEGWNQVYQCNVWYENMN